MGRYQMTTVERRATARDLMTRYLPYAERFARPAYAPKCAPTVYLERKPCVRAA